MGGLARHPGGRPRLGRRAPATDRPGPCASRQGRRQPGPMLLDRVQQCLDPFARRSRHREHLRAPAAGLRVTLRASSRSRRARSASEPRSALVTTAMSGISTMPAFMYCRRRPSGLDGEDHGVGEIADLGLGLADAHGLDHHDVVERAHQHGGGGAARRGRPAGRGRPSSGRTRPGPRGRPRSASGRRAARRRCGGRRGRPRSRPRSARFARQARTRAETSVDLPTPGRPGEADHVARAARPRRHRAGPAWRRRRVPPRSRPARARAPPCRLARSRQAEPRLAATRLGSAFGSAACAAARRAIGTR